MSIEALQVSKNYGHQIALNEVSFSVKPGEIVGFLGPNGAGKSTMMKIITCYLPPSMGHVSVCGWDVMNDPIEVKKKVGYLPEHNPLYLDMYVREYLEFVGGLYGMKSLKSRVDNIIDRVQLGDEMHKQIGALSKGYRQRVGLAQALIHDPEVLVLDEPTSGLDPNQLVDIRALIKEIGREKTVMLSTHIMQEVEAICDRVIIINKGEIVANERAEDIRNLGNKSQHIIHVEFDGTTSADRLEQIGGVEKAEAIGAYAWHIKAGEQDIRGAIFEFAVANKLKVLTIQKEENNLEDVFKSLTGKSVTMK